MAHTAQIFMAEIKKALPLVKNICSFQYSSSVRNFKSFWRSFNRSCLSKIHCKLEGWKIISATLYQHHTKCLLYKQIKN